MDDRPQFGLRSALLLGVLALACVLAMGAAILLRPLRFASHQDEIGYVLHQHGIAYDRITLSQTWRDTQNYYAYEQYSIYGADVTVNLHDGSVAEGRVDCRIKRTSCFLLLGRLGIRNEPLQDLETNMLNPWLEWLDRFAPRWR